MASGSGAWRIIATVLVGTALGCGGLESASEAPETRVEALAGDWQYRWGDSPRAADGSWAWLGAADEGWQGFAPPAPPPGRDGGSFLWVRARLPEKLPEAPHAYFRFVDRAFEAYVDGRRVHHHGELGDAPRAPTGRPWQVFALGDEAAGRWLTLRIWSDHSAIGFFGRTYLGTRAALLTGLLRAGWSAAVLSVLCLALAAVSLILLAFSGQRGALGQLAGLAASCGVYAFSDASAPLKQCLANAPAVWQWANFVAEVLVPVFYFGVYLTLIEGRLQRVTRGLRAALLACAAMALGGAALGAWPLLAVSDLLMGLLGVAILFSSVTAVRVALAGRAEVHWFLGGLCCAIVAGVHDIGVDLRLLGTERTLAAWGLSASAAFIGIYLARSYGRLVRERVQLGDRLGQQNLELSAARARIAEAAGQIREDTAAILRAASAHVQRSAHQTSANTRTTTTVSQIAVSAKQVASYAAEMIDGAERSERLGREGREVVEASVDGMERLAAQVQAIARRAEDLSEHSRRIGEAAETVRELADRSAMLAINASLEAARAGEEGRGFAVVAREMQGLAVQSRAAALEVGGILRLVGDEIGRVIAEIETGRGGAREAAGLARRAGDAIAGLAEAIEGSVQAARQIAVGTREQSQGIDEIVGAMADSARAVEDALGETHRIENEAKNLAELSSRLGELAAADVAR